MLSGSVEPSARSRRPKSEEGIACPSRKSPFLSHFQLLTTLFRNTEDLTGKFPARRLEDAAAIEVVFQEDPDEWRSWAIDASEGEMAGLLHRASRHEVEFRMQVPDLKMARDIAQWTSRKIRESLNST